MSTTPHQSRVLIVDDLPDELHLLAYYLEKAGYQILQAPNGKIALQIAERAIPDLILLDIQMPEMGGFETCERLKQIEALKDIPVIFVSGLNETIDKVKAFQAGGVDYITKPYEKAELLARVDTHLRLKELTEGLEGKVRERTQDLASANQQLIQEISERERAETALRESEEKFRRIFETMQDGYLLSDMDGNVILANPAAAELLHYETGELLSKNTAKDIYVDPQDSQKLRTELAQKHQLKNYEILLKRKDGKTIVADCNIQIVMDQTGEPFALEGVFRDITERKQAQQLEETIYQIAQASSAADDLEELFCDIHAIIRNVMIAENFYIALYDPDTNLLSFPFYVDEMDHPPEPGPPKKGLTEYVLRSGESLFCDQALNKQLKKRGEIELVGSYSPIWLGVPLMVEQQVIGVMVVQDYHNTKAYGHRELRILQYVSSEVAEAIARKRADQALQESQARYQAIVQDQTELITRWLPDGTRTFVNDAYCRYFGQSAQSSIGKRFFDLISPEDREMIRQKTDNMQPENNIITYEERVSLPNGKTRWLLWSDRGIFDETGELQEIQSIGRDITEGKLAQEQIQRQIERLAALRAVDQAIATSFDLQVTLDVLLKQAIPQLGVDAAAILLLVSPNQNFDYVVQRGFRFQANHANIPLRFHETLAGQVTLKRRTTHIPDLNQIDNLSASFYLEGEGFIAYVGVPLIVKGQVKGVLEVLNRTQISPEPDWFDFLETLAGQAAIAIDNTELFNGLERSNLELMLAYNTTLEGWAKALELRDFETRGHSQRVTDLTMKLARSLGLSNERLTNIYRGALLHDIGKMGIPDKILLKPGPLTDEEWEIMRQHPTYAYDLLSPIEFLRPAIDIPRYHHEKWDGSGYPGGLKGEEIPLEARIFAIIDVWDALLSDRPYRKALTHSVVLEYIQSQIGKHFDPRVAQAFLEIIKNY